MSARMEQGRRGRGARRGARRVRALIAGAVLALLAACASRSEAPAGGGEARVLRVGTSGDYPPFSQMEGDQVTGFSAALMEAYATERGLRLVWVRFRWPELVADLAAGRFDVAASGITVRPERSLVGRFTVPVVRHGAVLLLRRPAWAVGAGAGAEDPLAVLQALDRAELRVAVNRGGHLERVARGHFRHAQIEAIPDNAAVREALASGRVDAALTNTVEAPRWAQGLEGIERIGPFTRDTVALYVSTAEPGLATDLDTWLLAQEERGVLAQLRAHHLGPGAPEPTARPVEALLAATAERLALMPWVAAAKQRAGQAIEDLSQEASVLEAARAEVRKAAGALNVPAPADDAVTAFFQAQMDAAKALQRRAGTASGTPSHSLNDELRPALGRISARLSTLLPRIPPGLDPVATRQKARNYLASSGLEADEIDLIAEALVAVSNPPPAPAAGK